ncbi:hypothetical protein GCM10010912_08060 [Paenibacillus albidus]|uniref:Uncharacterized protein n=1 Tax=Paenibacillus albidus TaxID=2041023 RepID=A0A917C1J1_9BACL|nr:hypothetical protein GCM10010912_08060 [Paenibacillus albidus]
MSVLVGFFLLAGIRGVEYIFENEQVLAALDLSTADVRGDLLAAGQDRITVGMESSQAAVVSGEA